MTKRRARTVLLFLLLLSLGTMLSACENFDMDKLDIFGLNEKKKLPGDRKPLFPQGVPGVTQGIPPELMKGNQPPPADPNATAAATPDTAEEAAPPPAKPKAQPKPKPRVAKRPPAQRPAQVTVSPAPQQGTQQQQQQPQDGQAPWPTTTAQQPSPWPSSPPPGTFQR